MIDQVFLFDLGVFFVFSSAVFFSLALISWARIGWQVRHNSVLRWNAIAWMFALDNGIMAGLTAYQAYRTYSLIKGGPLPSFTTEQLIVGDLLWFGLFIVSAIHLGFALGIFKTSRPGQPGARGKSGESNHVS